MSCLTNKQLVMSRRGIMFTYAQMNRFIRKTVEVPCFGNLGNQSSKQHAPDKTEIHEAVLGS
jgi:hypothetical protein